MKIVSIILSILLIAATSHAQDVVLTWTDNSTNEDGFRIERAPGSCTGTFAQIAQVGPNVQTFTDTGLPEGTDFCWRLKAYNTQGESVYSNNAPATTKATMTVTRSGTGTGSVVSNPAGINCGTVCTFAFAGKTVVTMTATPLTGSNFTGWSGACSGTGPCTVTMDGTKNVTATFTAIVPPNAAPSNLLATPK